MSRDQDDRCALARRLRAIDDAFTKGDLTALRAAVEHPSVVPNGLLPVGFSVCLVQAIYRSPLAFIRELLDLGADPNVEVDDGFPPLIAALTCTRDFYGVPRRPDVEQIVELLLARGADPNQRGLNDWTALHMAVVERNLFSTYRLLRAGADPDLKTRIDDLETPVDLARAANLTAFVDLLTSRARPAPQRLRSGLLLLVELPGDGEPVRRQHSYDVRLRMWLHRGDPVIWPVPWGPIDTARLEDDGATLMTRIQVNRGQLMNGLFYGLDGMRVGGLRLLEVAPQLAYGDRGVPGVVPAGALVTVEVTVLG